MPYSVEGKLVVAISSRALFDFEEENGVFDRDGEGAYINLQFARLTQPAVVAVGIALNTSKLTRSDALAACKATEDALGLPCQDPVTMGVGRIVDKLLSCFAN